MVMFHQGNRELQRHFGSTALADRLVGRLRRSEFNDEDRELIHSLEFFFVATAADGQPDCSFKGGPPGFARVVRSDLLVWPDYDGNGMFKSLGNIRRNPFVGLLFIRMGAAPKRLRVNGRAEVVLEDSLMTEFVGAQALIRVTPIDIFPNCPRYIPDLAAPSPSPYVPREDRPPVEPAWKSNPAWKDVVPARRA
jgi:predicted pyridoxine 5'-phosphate oxidase superfamily flavin-nucleotide-binding protein